LDVRKLVAKPVLVGRKKHLGVIGAKPIHLTTDEERKKTVPLEKLRIDMGPAGSDNVKLGDRAVFASKFYRAAGSLCGKALDDRLGVVTLIELMRLAPDHIEFQAAFTVQEEVGLRGAKVAAYKFNPDMAVVIDATPANDVPVLSETPNMQFNTRLDHGPAVYIADSATLSDPRLFKHFTSTAEKYRIPYQIRQPGGGGTDAGAIHKARMGVPSISISIPVRYPHTPLSIVRLKDWQNTFALLLRSIQDLTAAVLERK
jgi:endoglucanase